MKLLLLASGSAAIVWVSWPSLRNRRSHGFYRFFAFESILILFLLNVEHWFRNPFAVHQIISWVLLTISLVLVVNSFFLLRVVGKPEGQIENTTRVVSVGVYKHIRHPLYSSLLLLTWGAFLKDPSAMSVVFATAASGFLFATAKVEEAENQRKFGEAYGAYMRTTRMFIPFIFWIGNSRTAKRRLDESRWIIGIGD